MSGITIQQSMITNKAIINTEAFTNTTGISSLAPTGGRQELSLASLPQPIPTAISDKPVLKSPLSNEMAPEQLINALSDFDLEETEKAAELSSVLQPKIVNELHRIFQNAEQKAIDGVSPVKVSKFLGIMNSNIINEISNLIRKVASAINLSDRQIISAFVILSGKMTEAAAASTIKEGKKMMESAMINFSVSLGVSGVGAAFQAKSLHTQNKSINTNLKMGTNNINTGNKLSQLNGQASELSGKNNSTVLKGKDGNVIELTDQATAGQKALAAQNSQSAADSTKAYGQNQLNEHNNIITKEGVKRGVAEQGARLSDSAGNMAGSSAQADAKVESSNAMIGQETSSAARKVAENAEKMVSENNELLKKMNEALNHIIDDKINTNKKAIPS